MPKGRRVRSDVCGTARHSQLLLLLLLLAAAAAVWRPGTYNDKDYIPNLTTPCTACPTGSTTSKAGGDAANSCNRE